MTDLPYITVLREWRLRDHEDNITLSRNDVIMLLEEIDGSVLGYELWQKHGNIDWI